MSDNVMPAARSLVENNQRLVETLKNLVLTKEVEIGKISAISEQRKNALDKQQEEIGSLKSTNTELSGRVKDLTRSLATATETTQKQEQEILDLRRQLQQLSAIQQATSQYLKDNSPDDDLADFEKQMQAARLQGASENKHQ